MKKLVSIALALSVTTLFTTSCSGGDDDIFTPALDRETKCTIKVVGDYKNFEALEAEFDLFGGYGDNQNAIYPNVTLEYEYKDGYSINLATILQAEEAPNIFFSYAAWTGGDEKYDVARAHMEDLSDPKLKINLDCVRPGLLNHDSEGRVPMVPVFSRTYGTLVNNNLFRKENIEVPATWDELLEACEKFAEKGYENPVMGYTAKDSSCLMNTVAYPAFIAALANNPEALTKANNLDPEAGEYMREPLTKTKQLIDKAVNLTNCNEIKDNYNAVIMRFFEGDVPMMVCAGDTASGTKKRESQSEAFVNNPFEYSYVPIPMTDKGGYFIDSPSIQFSVNKDCKNLDMTNEFMRFLVRNKELNAMAEVKGLVTPTKKISFDSMYAAFAKVPEERTFSPEALGVKDPLAKQIRIASFKVGKGEITIDEAIVNYGKL